MSKLHVTQIGGYLQKTLSPTIDMADYTAHTDACQVQKAFLTRALSALAISTLAEADPTALRDSVTDGSHDGGIDGIYFDAKDRVLYLVQAKWHEDGNGSIELGDALKFIDGVNKVLSNELESFNPRVQARKGDIQNALFDANAKFVLVIVHTGQQKLSEEVSSRLDAFVSAQNDTSELMQLRVLSQVELHKAVSAGVAGTPIALEVQIKGWGQVRDPYAAFYGQVCAADIANWADLHGSRLFSSNLRQFLGPSTVNDDIVATLKERPEDFWYLNNGITAIAVHLAKKPIGGQSTDSGTFECTGFSVVNGAQTVGSIHAAHAEAPEQVAKAMVPVRIISTGQSPQTFGTDVTRCTNTQNAIAKRDFVALDPQQERIRQELHFDGVEYAYKAGSSISSGGSRFDLTEATVAQACTNEAVDMAVQAKREISRLWDDISKPPYKALFHAGVPGPVLWERVQALRSIDAALQVASKPLIGRDALICVHGNRFIEWVVMQQLQLSDTNRFDALEPSIPTLVQDAVTRTIAAVKAKFADSYPASLFKNLSKCRVLANEVSGK